jgi:hypothetical protein
MVSLQLRIRLVDVMNVSDPTTWHDLSKHPRFNGDFDPRWYDGDVASDLAMLRQVAETILEEFPQAQCDLNVLDDCTMYITADVGNSVHADVFLARTDDNRPCYFIDLLKVAPLTSLVYSLN